MRISNLVGKITVWFVVCCWVIVSFVVNTAMALDGSGTEQDPWRIKSLEDFNDFASDANYWDDYTRLETDVNLAGMVYERAVIGDSYYDDGLIGTSFSGVFDGNDHKILNLTIDDEGAGNNYAGLFGNIDNGEVRNLGLEGGSVSAAFNTGGLVGSIYEGTISKCYSTGDVKGSGSVGGLIGLEQYSSVSNCYSTGNVSGTGDAIGGLVGYCGGSVSNCYSTSDVYGDTMVGGLAGGGNRGSIINCYSTGDVNSDGYAGGLMGWNGGRVENCYSTGDVQGGGDEKVGGLVGHNIYGAITNCYSTGIVKGEINAGGLVGFNYAKVFASFWDIETSGQTTSDGGTGKTTNQMQTKSTFIDVGWDFDNTWNICEGTIYPRLLWQIPAMDFLCPNEVDFFDFSFFAGHWAEVNCPDTNDCEGTDLDQLGTVDARDLKIFIDNWLIGSRLKSPPAQASNSNPPDCAVYVNPTSDLRWTAGYGATSHDVYFGTSSPPPFVCNQTDAYFDPGAMDYNTTYYWRIDTCNNKWGKTTGTVWSFTTAPAPSQASNPNPADDALLMSVPAGLSWTAGAFTESHDVYFGTTNPPPFIKNQTATTFDPGTITMANTYYWRIDEVNAYSTTTGIVWSFDTFGPPPPPP